MVGVITAVLAGSTAALMAIRASDHSLTAALISGAAIALAALVVLTRFQRIARERAAATPLVADDDEEPS
jgi:hypothetical protein